MTTIDELVYHNRGLVFKMAYDLSKRGPEYDDLVAEGNIGLVIAAQKFNPELGKKFGTYAWYWVRAYMFDYLSKNAHGMVRRPLGNFVSRRFSIPGVQAELVSAGIEPTNENVATAMELTSEQVEKLLSIDVGKDVNMDAPSSGRPKETIGDQIGDESSDPATAIYHQQIRETAHRLIAGMAPIYQDIARSRIMADEPEPLRDIGRRWGVSRERIRQLEAIALRRLRSVITGMESPRPVRRLALGLFP